MEKTYLFPPKLRLTAVKGGKMIEKYMFVWMNKS